MRFSKYHALGNDYIVLDPANVGEMPSSEKVRAICHRNFGVGSDGILYGPTAGDDSDFGLRILNPDASEAEKSGNGLRIFSRYLWDKGLVTTAPFTILTLGGKVSSQFDEEDGTVTVEMGKVSFDSRAIPVEGPDREVLNESMTILGQELTYCAATIGNPHCVFLCEAISAEQARELGPLVETDPRFPNRTNVQFMQIRDRDNIGIEIWERGAGYTLASGSSSSAAAAVAYRLGLCGGKIRVHMPGGMLDIQVSQDFAVRMKGPVTKVSEGTIDEEIFGNAP